MGGSISELITTSLIEYNLFKIKDEFSMIKFQTKLIAATFMIGHLVGIITPGSFLNIL